MSGWAGGAGADGILTEVLRHRLMAIVTEMSETLRRAAYSPSITEIRDYSNAIHTPGGDVVAQALGIPLFLGAMPFSLRAAVAATGLDRIEPGDIIIGNDPYEGGGTHLNDINLVAPIFHQGKLVLFAQCKAHWRDIGGKDAGSWSPDARNIFQEGLRLPPLKLYARGVRDETLVRLLLANVRLPENSRGDLAAQVAALRVAGTRLGELLDRYYWETVAAAIGAILDHGERMVRAQIAAIPDGVYEAAGALDSDGTSEDPVPLRVRATVAGSDLLFDFTGSSPQRPGAAGNTVLAATTSAVRLAVKCLTDPALPANEGCYRPIRIVAPEGSCVHARPPAPVTVGLGDVTQIVVELIFRALAPALPDRTIAGLYGSVQVLTIAGADPATGALFIHGQPNAGGWGARRDKDGPSALMCIANGDCLNVPVEVTESRFPLRVERLALAPDSGGAGHRRGGLGLVYDYRVLSAGTAINTGLMHYRELPYGLFGGREGAGSEIAIVNPAGEEERKVYRAGGLPVATGATVSLRLGGGGRLGRPAGAGTGAGGGGRSVGLRVARASERRLRRRARGGRGAGPGRHRATAGRTAGRFGRIVIPAKRCAPPCTLCQPHR